MDGWLERLEALAVRPLAVTTRDRLAIALSVAIVLIGAEVTWFGRNQFLYGAWTWLDGVLILVGVAWWLRTGRAGSGLKALAGPLAIATAAPIMLYPLEVELVVGLPLATIPEAAALLLLADGLSGAIEADGLRRAVRLAVVALAEFSIVAGLWMASFAPELTSSLSSIARWLLLASIAAVPGLFAARSLASSSSGPGALASGRLVESNAFLLAAITPAVALITPAARSESVFLAPIVLWVAILVIAGMFTVRPLVLIANRAQIQRDVVIAATEAERARVAADIHDDALQELTLLVRRLDAAGDVEGADIARTVSDRLRAICGDLRLPILDDLGVGPALDWLVLRIERLAGGEVRLERNDGMRPPSEVELAIFRVAQEALSNAVRHGKPPIVVRYRATAHGVSLSVDDAGPGIADDAEDAAAREGHFGLLNMEQRAQHIGAILDVRRWPTGGTHVALEWRPH